MNRSKITRPARLRAGILAGSMLLLAGSSLAFVLAQGQVTLRYKLNKGQKLVYTTSSSSSIPGAPTSAKTTIDILSLTSKGFTAKTTVEIPGNDKAKPAPYTVEYDYQGKPLQQNMKGVSGMSGFAQYAGFMGVVYPTTPVKAGSTWTTNIDMKKAMAAGLGGMMTFKGSSIVPMKYTITGITKKGSKNIATINIIVKSTLNMEMNAGSGQGGSQQKMTMTMGIDLKSVAQVDTATGILQQQDADGTMTITAGGRTQTVPMKSTVKLQ